MKLVPCSIDEIKSAMPSKKGTARADLLSFLALETPCAKATELEKPAKNQASYLGAVAKKYGFPVKVSCIGNTLYFMDITKVPEIAVAK